MEQSSPAERLYRKFMGVDDDRLTWAASADSHASMRDVLYYAYRKGFWQLVRGTAFRPRLGHSGRFFLGRGTRILFPKRLRVGSNVAVGDYVFMNCYGRTGVELGDRVRLREFGWIQVTSHLSNPGEGIVVGPDTYIGPHCILGGAAGIAIGREVTMGAYVQLLAEDHSFGDTTKPVGRQGVRRRGIKLGDGCWLGNSVIVLDGVHIGDRAVVGAGSVVTRDIPPGAVAAGNPARVIREKP
jgi:acetyltransferase-like isoleucine patch superfamily enzyme